MTDDRFLEDGGWKIEDGAIALDHPPSSILHPPSSVVVIGYGNDLRGDDGAGRRVAAAVARWRRPGVRALSVHQLTPELAVELAAAELAIFVDAYQAQPGQADIRVQPLEPDEAYQLRGHSGDPRGLLALARLACGRCPPACWITIPARCFAYGAELSPETRRGAAEALRQIRALVLRVMSCELKEP